MQQWLVLVRKTISAEWPSFEALHCLQVFNCSSGLSAEATSTLLGQLGKLFQVEFDAVELERQFRLCKPMADKLRRSIADDPTANLAAWGEAALKASLNQHDVSALTDIIAVGAAAAGATTSSNERDFSAKRSRANAEIHSMELRITGPGTVATLASDLALCHKARGIWQEGFGAPRKSGRRRKPNWRDPTTKAGP